MRLFKTLDGGFLYSTTKWKTRRLIRMRMVGVDDDDLLLCLFKKKTVGLCDENGRTKKLIFFINE